MWSNSVFFLRRFSDRSLHLTHLQLSHHLDVSVHSFTPWFRAEYRALMQQGLLPSACVKNCTA